MGKYCLLLYVMCRDLSAQAHLDVAAQLRSYEVELRAVLNWEILWDDLPVGFRMPPKGDGVRFVLRQQGTYLFYCSAAAGVCAQYVVNQGRNWARLSSSVIEAGNDADEALFKFAKLDRGAKRQYVLGQRKGELKGIPAPSSGFWTAQIGLDSREEIIAQYKKLRPDRLGTLKAWITPVDGVSRPSATIACFGPFDPLVFYSIDGGTAGPVVVAVFWDHERDSWVVASYRKPSHGLARFDFVHRTIQAIACSTIP